MFYVALLILVVLDLLVIYFEPGPGIVLGGMIALMAVLNARGDRLGKKVQRLEI